MNPATNSGTTGGSRPPASDPIRWCTPAAATIGASSSTRVSLTMTAAASAAAPAVCAVATTCPTSCTEAPAHAPKASGPSPSGPISSGRTPMASVPQRVTSAIGSTVSCCRIRRAAAIAPIAEAPQMAKPAATSSGTGGGSRNNRPMP